jgi:hypothetical protein
LIRNAADVEELDVPPDGWKIVAPIGTPCVALAMRWYGHVKGFRPEWAPPHVYELAGRYGT